MTPTPTASFPASVGVLGGGRMGTGIAHAFLVAGSEVTVLEADDDRARAAGHRVCDLVERTAERGLLTGAVEETTAGLDVSTTYATLETCELIVEAVPEDRALKQRLLGRLSEVLAADAVVASNTSSFSITDLARHVVGPGRFLGMHFFNPVPSSDLVEVVVGRDTDPAVVARVESWVTTLGKTPVTVADSPGFATSRLGLALGLEAIRMLEDGVAPAADIDAAMVLGYRHPVGPLRLTDMVGLDVRLGVADYLAEKLGERFRAPQLLRDKVADGELGRKVGRGFHVW